MKKFFYLLMSISLIIGACSKNETPTLDESPDLGNPVESPFNAKLGENKTYKVGERVEFKLEGNPESIDFFPGTPGYEYADRNGRLMPSGMELNFSMYFSLSTSTWPGDMTWEPISLLVSTDFDGDYSNLATVQQATWIDVTDRLTFPNVRATTPVGPIDLSDLTEIGKPFYFAIKYVNITGRPSYLIQTPVWYSILPSGKELIGHLTLEENTMGFEFVDENTTYKSTITYANPPYQNRFTIRGNANAAAVNAQTWIVSKGFFDVQEVMAEGSVPIPIKSSGNSALTSYGQVYTAPGSYEAYFVATILDKNGERYEEVKKVTVVVEE